MPDWFYRTCSQPMLFRLPVSLASGIGLGVMGTLTRLPGGPLVVDFLGHMVPDPRLQRTLDGVTFPGPVGLGAEVDPTGFAIRAFQRFGTGFVEVGPIRKDPVDGSRSVERWPEQQGWWTPEPRPMPGLTFWKSRLAALPASPVPVVARLSVPPGTPPDKALRDIVDLVHELAPYVSVLALDSLRLAAREGWSDETWRAHVLAVVEAVRQTGKRIWVCLPVDFEPSDLPRWRAAALLAGDGVMIDGALSHESGLLHGTPGRELALETLHALRALKPDATIVASGGINTPADALRFLEAGASLVRVDTGLVYAGPGLVKRINEALLAQNATVPAADLAVFRDRHPPGVPLGEQSWFWSALMGTAMLIIAVAALVIACTRIVLPYDEVFSGLTREQLDAANPRLLAFLAHDRVTLGGASLGVAIIQLFLSIFGIRRGLHWARVIVLTSAAIGFSSFFLFLGFGYFDPFHAFVTAVLFQLFVLAIHTRLSPPVPTPPMAHDETDRWRLALWGQLLIVAQGVAVLTAGLTISFIGITTVFVQEDLDFMQTTAEALRSISPRLVPLVAHDRATFGGMLICSGTSVLMTALWGFRERAAWVWWMLFLAGTSGYVATLMVHLHVGYTDPHHLAPAILGLFALWLGLALSRPYLLGPFPETK